MLSRQRLQERFLEMIQVYSPPYHEKDMALWLKQYLEQRGLTVWIDKAGEGCGSNSGNVIALLKGDRSDVEPICFCAHMDVIEPCKDINPVFDGFYIKSDGTTTLGGDDKGGISAILEGLEDVIESGCSHPDIYLLFTVCEEVLMVGSKHLDCSLLPCRRVVVADGGGNCDTIFYKAPQGLSIEAVFHGKAAHAGLAPETGINAVVMASKAIAQMQIGRIDEETTTNIGRIEGGGPNNVVPDTVRFTAEMRSHNAQTLENQRAHMERCCMEAAASMGGSCEFLCEQTYPALSIDPQGELCRKVQSAMEKGGISAKLEPTGGGSDANVMDGFGYECVILGVGMENVHSTKEQLNMNELWKATRVMRHLMDA